jgi:two-component sensor histidine kinase
MQSIAEPSAPREHFHPLEVIPFFRRWPRSMPRDVLYTAIWSTLFGVGFYLVGSVGTARPHGWAILRDYLLISNIIGFTIHGLYSAGGRLGLDCAARRAGFVAKVAYYACVPLAGVGIGMAIATLVLGMPLLQWLARPGAVLSMLLISLFISLVLSVIFFWRERAARAEAAIALERARAESIERQAALANLRALQAQIEPHFLFNTLANVSSLIDAEPARARGMLDDFIRFLRASLAATRREQTTLGEEAELIAAYLDVLQVRMGTRLRYAIDVPDDARGVPIAPMLLQPIVENAIRHGLEPKVEGGEVTLRVRREGAHVSVVIADTGVGFAPVTHGGVGLENLRGRLQALYGEHGGLAIEDNQPSGTRVRLRIPA